MPKVALVARLVHGVHLLGSCPLCRAPLSARSDESATVYSCSNCSCLEIRILPRR